MKRVDCMGWDRRPGHAGRRGPHQAGAPQISPGMWCFGKILGLEEDNAEVAPASYLPFLLQSKLLELQAGKKSLEDQVEALRAAKEEAERPEKEAKEQHRKLWEGRAAARGPEGLARGPGTPAYYLRQGLV